MKNNQTQFKCMNPDNIWASLRFLGFGDLGGLIKCVRVFDMAFIH